jgi:hypothetical protein
MCMFCTGLREPTKLDYMYVRKSHREFNKALTMSEVPLYSFLHYTE